MKRKTNLFYTAGSDSNFITFSNYGESMTGNYLSTDTKLFPSTFICGYVDGLNNSNRGEYIKNIAANYENKLAFLRDKCIEHNYDVEKKIKPLNWLLEILLDNKLYPFEIRYIGQVTEQDYNGIFADTICTIDASAKLNGKVVRQEISTEHVENYDETLSYLYGWSVKKDDNNYQYIGPEEYSNAKPILDGTTYYNYESSIKTINLSDTIDGDIEFNIIIPLYDVVNINSSTNTTSVSELSNIDLDDNNLYTRYVPYGIWFSGDESVILPRHDYSPSWSLVLSSQFKPFPYSRTSVDDISDTAKLNAYQTFSQILVKQNQIIDRLTDVATQMISLNNRVSDLEGNIKSFGTSYNIDGLHIEMVELQKEINKIKEQL